MKVQMINVEKKKKQSKKYKGLKLLRCPELTDNDRTIKNRVSVLPNIHVMGGRSISIYLERPLVYLLLKSGFRNKAVI